MSKFYVMRDTGSGAYIDGPFKSSGSARRRVSLYRSSGWAPVIVRANNRSDAFHKFEVTRPLRTP